MMERYQVGPTSDRVQIILGSAIGHRIHKGCRPFILGTGAEGFSPAEGKYGNDIVLSSGTYVRDIPQAWEEMGIMS
jgi:hypothetical protein